METLSLEAAKGVLLNNVIGRLGCADKRKTYIIPVLYVFDGKDIFAHSVEGMKINMRRQRPQVCFEVDEIENIRNWKSVIAFGKYQEINDSHQRLAAIKLFVARKIRLKTSERAIIPDTREATPHPFLLQNFKPVIYRIIIDEITGRYERTSN